MKHLKRFNEEFENFPLEWPWKKQKVEIVECPCCDGKGNLEYNTHKEPDLKEQECPVCKGKKEVPIDNKEYKKYIKDPFSYKEKHGFEILFKKDKQFYSK